MTSQEEYKKRDLIDKSYSYLCDNFHKFSDGNKIRIALEIVKKDLPTKMEGEGLAQRVVQIVYTNKEQVGHTADRTEAVSEALPE